MQENNKDLNTNIDHQIPTGMLSSPHIAYLAHKYKIIKDFDDLFLGPASYHMRIGGNVLTWDEGKKVEFVLGEFEDINKNIRTSVELRPNSLTFLTTIEEFRLPKDIIARFNLKSKWVHQGLLLGTGPIVDPQLHARLLIPVHNFSSQSVSMKYGNEFISVEFTKTLNPADQLDAGDGKKLSYVENDHWDYNFDKYREKISNKKVESSISSSIEKYDKSIKEQEKRIEITAKESKNTIVRFSWAGAISLFSAIIGLALFFYTTWQVVDSAKMQVLEALKTIKQYKDQNVDLNSSALKSTIEDMQKQLLEAKTNIIILDRYKEEIKLLDVKVKELEKKLDQKTKIGTSKN